MEPFLRGGGQEKGMRSGTENVFGALAFSRCLERYYNKDKSTQKEMTERFIKALAALKGCSIVPAGRLEKPDLYSPYVVQAGFAHIPGNVMLRALDAKGISISTGSACSTKKNSRPILEAMNVPSDIRETAVRFSFGPHTTQEAVDALLAAVMEINAQFNR